MLWTENDSVFGVKESSLSVWIGAEVATWIIVERGGKSMDCSADNEEFNLLGIASEFAKETSMLEGEFRELEKTFERPEGRGTSFKGDSWSERLSWGSPPVILKSLKGGCKERDRRSLQWYNTYCRAYIGDIYQNLLNLLTP